MPLGINIWATYALSAFWHGEWPPPGHDLHIPGYTSNRVGGQACLRGCCAARNCLTRPPRLLHFRPLLAGFYPGYYLFFLSAPLLQTLEKGFASKLTPRVAAIGGPVAAVYNAVSRVAVPFGLNYLVMPFVALSWDQGITAWSSLYYVGE